MTKEIEAAGPIEYAGRCKCCGHPHHQIGEPVYSRVVYEALVDHPVISGYWFDDLCGNCFDRLQTQIDRLLAAQS